MKPFNLFKSNPKLWVSLISIVAALIVGSIIIIFTGNNPIEAYGYMIEGSFGSVYRLSEIAVQATPLIFTGLAITFAYRSGVFSIGADGQLLMGAVISMAFVTYFKEMNGVLLTVIGLLLGMIGGALWGALAGFLKSFRGISEIISTMMLNYIALYFASFLFAGVLKSPEGMQPRTIQVPEAARLLNICDGTRLHLGTLIAIIVAVIIAFVLFRTAAGTKFRAVGLNAEAANCLGINVSKYTILSLVISGALAGLGGAIELFSVQTRVQGGFCADYGFDGIAVALMGQLNPYGVIGAALFFAVLKVGANYMELMTNIPSSAITIIQGTIIVFIAMGSAIVNYDKIPKFALRKKSKTETAVS